MYYFVFRIMYTPYEILNTKYFLFPVPSFPFGIFLQNIFEFFFGKFRPIGIGKKEFTIDRLPWKKVGKPPLAAGPNDQVWVGHRARRGDRPGQPVSGRCRRRHARRDVLRALLRDRPRAGAQRRRAAARKRGAGPVRRVDAADPREIGRASCRERV